MNVGCGEGGELDYYLQFESSLEFLPPLFSLQAPGVNQTNHNQKKLLNHLAAARSVTRSADWL